MTPDHIVYRCDRPVASSVHLPTGYRIEFWRPSYLQRVPAGFPRNTYAIWWLFHQARIFHNPQYAVVRVLWGDELAHRLGVFPGWFRFPFMKANDLQLGDLWTAPAHRGRGLASAAVLFAMANSARADSRAFWYLTHEKNVASIRTAERAGFVSFGHASRTRPWGLRLAGQFRIVERASPERTGRPSQPTA
jgi:RimJ/RimL family protein N-acetyltransferase